MVLKPSLFTIRTVLFKRYYLKSAAYMSSMGSGISLQRTIKRGEFYSVPETELLEQVRDCFAPELDRLKNARAVETGSSPKLEACGKLVKRTPSEILYGENYDEINRTLTGVLALRWIVNREYDVFVSGQAPGVKLHQDSFEYLRHFFVAHLTTWEDIFALVLSMVVNDLGKDPNLEKDYYRKTGDDTGKLDGQNHDTILYEAANAGMVPALNLLSSTYRGYVMLGLELGSQLNAGQLAQAENVPVNLEILSGLNGQEHAFNLKYMEQVLDVAGAAAHYDSRGARNFIEPVFQGFRTVYEVSLDIIAEKCTLREGYDQILTKRGDILSEAGFRHLSVSKKDERALLRLLTMGRTTTKEQADLFSSAFDALEPANRDCLVTGLNIDGTNDNETAILPYYMPAMLSETLNVTKDLSIDRKRDALTSLMRYLARVLLGSGDDGVPNMPQDWLVTLKEQQNKMGWPQWKDGMHPGIVIERNMMKARETINSEDFKKDPHLALRDLEIPLGQVLQRRRTSHSLDVRSSSTKSQSRKPFGSNLA